MSEAGGAAGMTETRDAFIQRARECEHRGDLKDAARVYRAYLESSPRDAEVYALLGDALSRDGLEDDAIIAYEGTLTYAPEHFGAHVGIARVLTRKGWRHAALVVLEALQRMRPDDPAAREEVAQAKDAIAQPLEPGQG